MIGELTFSPFLTLLSRFCTQRAETTDGDDELERNSTLDLRRDIARMQTILRQQQVAAGTEGEG